MYSNLLIRQIELHYPYNFLHVLIQFEFNMSLKLL